MAQAQSEIGRGKLSGGAMERLLKANAGLICQAARYYAHPTDLPYEDALQEARIGFFLAVERFQPTGGAKLSTYAVYWMRQRLVRERGGVINIPEPQQKDRRLLFQRRNDLHEQLGRVPTRAELALSLNMTEQQVSDLMRLPMRRISLDELIGIAEGDGSSSSKATIADAIADETEGPEAQTMSRHSPLWDLVCVCVRSDRDRDILARRFGFYPYRQSYTTQEIADDLDMQTLAVKRILSRVLTYLRRNITSDQQLTPRKRQPVTAMTFLRQRNKDIIQFVEQGNSVDETARVFALSRARIYQIVTGAKY